MRYSAFLQQGLLCLLPFSSALSAEERVNQVLDNYGTDNANSFAPSHNSYQTRFPGVTWDQRNWRLRSTALDQGHYQSRGSIANGYIGINVASAGPFFELDTPVDGDVINGWPLFSRRQTFAGLAGFYDVQPTTNSSNFPWLDQYGGESVISGIPHWSALVLDLGNGNYLDATVDKSTISNYATTYDYKAGVLSWHYTWTPKGQQNNSFVISYKLFANKLDVNQAVVKLSITPSANGNASVVNVIDGYSAVRTDFVKSGSDSNAIYTSVKPTGINNVTAWVYAVLDGDNAFDFASAMLVDNKPYVHQNGSSIAQSVNVKLSAGKTVSVVKYVGAASTDGFADPQKTAKKAALDAKRRGFDDLLRSHVSEWAQVMPDESTDDFTLANGNLPEDPFIIESAITAVVNPYYLLQNTLGENALRRVKYAPINDWSIPVGGLTSDSYAGLIFWDADVWMQPGLVAAFPESAKRITNYRVAKYQEAIANVKTAYSSSQANTSFSPDAAIYPWTSGRFGNCTGTGPCFDYEYHLNGDIAISLTNQWVASGDTDTFQKQHFPIYNSIATVYADLLKKNGSYYILTNMTDPDEYANHVDAGGYTMPLIAQTLVNANAFRQQFGMDENTTWNEMASNVLIIRENDITLEYTTMTNDVAVKQADVVLRTYPLDDTTNYSPKAALDDLDYYALKQSPDGPGMTYAIFSIVANEVSPSGCSAYTYAQYSYDPYIRGPFFQFSEQLTDDYTTNGGTHPAFPFLTGHGGANQVVLYGYLGLRLLPDDILHIDPNLPPQIPQVKYRTFYWRGWPIQAESNYTHTKISRATTVAPLVSADPKYANASITVQVGQQSNSTSYKLPVDGTSITITNRQISSINTVSGNLVQCQAVQSSDTYQPGQFPMAAVDGAASTKWQPEYANNVSSITVTIPSSESGKTISGFYFDWAQAPPANATVILHNNSVSNPTISGFGQTAQRTTINVEVSNPVNASSNTNGSIVLPTGNTTNFTFPHPVPVSKFATLFIEGNQGLDSIDIKYENGTGATVAEWAILATTQSRLKIRASNSLSGRHAI
ncbi:alpha,alpha-trehalose glucohydrolase TreA/Ath1 [Talaromyces proteolyticus]|uniref:alpha,alpha-trehalase n=1 Tax=Talaromyces proteolyticus TaxID=1131652 RepID=A0AAD4KGI4_9EURO|nr:alpha,alpha-trehalose glucohydrolase TreA/Ath1 [Talaromyces proteolyticus]KAH8689872.1 alpha,alpha-trehalose glucohydrolase TreA/Ath1 [Talaromyces proteolyticus]